jgi:RNA polymerase sigma factor (sigma-70 family)
VATPPDIDVLDLDAALSRLASFDARKSRVAELRFFAGLTVDEIAGVTGVSPATVKRDWQVARAWLFDALSAGATADGHA